MALIVRFSYCAVVPLLSLCPSANEHFGGCISPHPALGEHVKEISIMWNATIFLIASEGGLWNLGSQCTLWFYLFTPPSWQGWFLFYPTRIRVVQSAQRKELRLGISFYFLTDST